MEDDQLRKRVQDELAWQALIDESQVDVDVADGVVTLVGTVGSYAEKVIAEHAAHEVSGVHSIQNEIGVKPSNQMHPTDEELRVIVEQVLAWDALVPEQDLLVSVVDGLVALTGSCAARAQADEAERAISHLSGVRDVLNRIEVTHPSPSPDEVRAVIADALNRRAVHGVSRLDVVIDAGTVTLSGNVQSPMERRAIIGAVSHAPGIAEVHDQLTVAPQAMPSESPDDR